MNSKLANTLKMKMPVVLVLALAVTPNLWAAAKTQGSDPYYTESSLFFPKPDSRGSTWKVPHFGPVGIGIDLVNPNFTMKISGIEDGSPAAKTGKLKKGQIIESVNGQGYKGPGLCEYYLRTGDKSVLPLIKQMTDEIREYMFNGGWSGRGKAGFSYGQLNAAGVHCVTFLLMAKYCGVDVDDYMLQTSLRQFFRFSGRGTVPYGDSFPENGYRDNGKTGGLAFAMAAAALLTPDGENSVYAKARDNCAMKSF
ncbi:MAG: DUF6288 domain-containing protein [Lentisphaeria bacterium]|nr:DUF6288 domain-containing protein [Lentisphaeria bacterium]